MTAGVSDCSDGCEMVICGMTAGVSDCSDGCEMVR